MEPARQSIETQVIDRAAKDPEFREQLKQDPQGTVARELGVQVPSEITVDVVEETPTRVYLVLPPVPGQPGQALSDQDLEAVAGGWTSSCVSCAVTCGGADARC